MAKKNVLVFVKKTKRSKPVGFEFPSMKGANSFIKEVQDGVYGVVKTVRKIAKPKKRRKK